MNDKNLKDGGTQQSPRGVHPFDPVAPGKPSVAENAILTLKLLGLAGLTFLLLLFLDWIRAR